MLSERMVKDLAEDFKLSGSSHLPLMLSCYDFRYLSFIAVPHGHLKHPASTNL